VLIASVDSVNEILVLISRESLRVDSEDATTVHVVDVSPHSLERDFSSRVIGHHACDFVDISVSISALMETKTPVGRHERKGGDLGVLLGDVAGRRTSDEVEVENTANDVVLQELLAVLLVDEDVHAVGIEEEDTVGAALAVVKVNGVSSIEVLSVGATETR
jgi:hypothetical protein